MNFCLSWNQSGTYLDQADEIKVPWIHKDKIPNMVERYPDAVFILQHMYTPEKIDWDEYEELFDQCDGNLIICLNNVRDCAYAYEKDLPFYYGYPIQTYEDFNSLILLDPYYIIPGAPLFFNLEYLKNQGASLRIFPNVCTLSNFPLTNKETGIWVRPEDIDYYDRYVDACEFFIESLEQERALFNIYKKDKQFIGAIGLIINDLLGSNVENDLINSEFIPVRTYCKQKCQSHENNCHICQNLFYLAVPDNLQYLLEK